MVVRIISKQKIIEFKKSHSNDLSSLESWYKIVRFSSFKSFQELRQTFPSVDKVNLGKGKVLTIFNINGNNIRLIAAIHYNSQMVFIRYILTHAEYDKGKWKN